MMGQAEDLPESDCAEGALHPRFCAQVLGQQSAEQTFLAAYNSNRLHHAWLITGPPGIGKASLAWRIARFLLAQPLSQEAGLFGAPEPPESLTSPEDTPQARRITALSEPALSLVRRSWDPKGKKLRSAITVDEIRELKRAFTLSLPDGGRRVVLVDAADDMNTAAANALLKLLEEPPKDTVFLLVSHLPSRLLPTIRSRCRSLACAPLDPEVVTSVLQQLEPDLDDREARDLAELSQGSVGTALRMHVLDGAALQRELLALFAGLPGLDRGRAIALSTALAARGQEERRELFLQLIEALLATLARQGTLGRSALDPDLGMRLAPNPEAGRRWAEAQQTETARVRKGLAVNLDPQSLILDMMLRIDRMAGRSAVS